MKHKTIQLWWLYFISIILFSTLWNTERCLSSDLLLWQTFSNVWMWYAEFSLCRCLIPTHVYPHTLTNSDWLLLIHAHTYSIYTDFCQGGKQTRLIGVWNKEPSVIKLDVQPWRGFQFGPGFLNQTFFHWIPIWITTLPYFLLISLLLCSNLSSLLIPPVTNHFPCTSMT